MFSTAKNRWPETMADIPYKVIVVVDREFGERLETLPRGIPIWIVDTSTSKPVARRLWRELPKGDHLTGITTFVASESARPEEIALSILDTVDLHHGPHSANPPYTMIEILGANLNDELRTELKEYGFSSFETLPEGFRATRPLPPD